MNRLLSDSVRLYFQTVLAYVMSFIMLMSFNVIFTWLGTYEIGYQLYEIDSEGNRILGETVYFEDGEEISYPTDKKYVSIRSEQTRAAVVAEGIFSQALMLALFIIFVNGKVSDMAKKDRTAVMYQGQKRNLLTGFAVGSVAAIPSAVFYVILVICRMIGKNIIQLEYYGNVVFMPIVQAITGRTQYLSEVSPLGMLALVFQVLALPAVAGVCYILSYKNVSFAEKIMYKKKEGR